MSNNAENLPPAENLILPLLEDFRCKCRVRLFDCRIYRKNIFSIECKLRPNTDKHRCFSKQKKLALLKARKANRTFQSNFAFFRSLPETRQYAPRPSRRKVHLSIDSDSYSLKRCSPSSSILEHLFLR